MPVHSAWFNPELVVYRGPEPLLTADVAFRSLHRDMTEKELDLFEFSAGGVAEPRARKQVTESAGINRHIVGDARALRKRRSDSIPASSLACDLARGSSEA